MKRTFPTLRIERLEDRTTPAAFLLPGNVTAAGVSWNVANNTNPGNTAGVATGGFGIVDAKFTALNGKSDAYDGAFCMGVNGTQFADPDGTVDLTGTTVTSDVVTLSGLDVTVEYFFDSNSATIRALYTYSNPSGADISATVVWGNNLGSDSGTVLDQTSSGDATLDATDRWLVTSDGATNNDPINTWVRYGPGTVLQPSSTLQTPAPNNGLYTEQFDITVPAGQTRRLMFFGQLHNDDDPTNAVSDAAVFDENATIANAGLLSGLSSGTLAEVLNWDFSQPSVTINQAAGQGDPTSSSTVNFTAVFSEAVTGFNGGDIVFGGTAGANTAIVTGSGTTYNVAVSGMTHAGTVIITIPSGAAVNGSGQSNLASTSTDNQVTFLPTQLLATGADAGGGPQVNVYNADSSLRFSFLAYASNFTGGVRVATGDITGDGIDDIVTAPGAGGGPHVRVFNGATGQLVNEFFAYDPGFAGGVFVAIGYVNGDNHAEIITGAGAGGGPHVKVYDGFDGSLVRSFFAYDSNFTGGVTVAAGDVDKDGLDDIITGAGPGGGPHVEAFSGQNNSVLRSFFAYPAGFSGGVFVASGDVNNDGFDDIITGAGSGGSPQVEVFSGNDLTLLRSFLAYAGGFSGGVRVASNDVDGDGFADLITGAGPGGGPHVLAYSGQTQGTLRSFFAYDPSFSGGVYVG
ncbi:MAG: hypothetical protein ACJ8C4_21780 [Gemmataceae bacterium]